jgi:glycosyltransferase involved in cell wall biosynthesis
VEYPKVSVITPTYRRELLKRCVENYNGFEYPNKELVIAFNGNELPHPSELDISERNDITVTFVPGDLFAGAALNMGHQAASGEYFFRVDDDDDYGKNYILDMVIMARSINADLFGKPPSPIEFDGDDLVYYKLQSIEWTIVPSEFLEKNQFWLGGNSLSGSSQFYHVVPYNDYQYSAADTELQLSICSFASGSGGAVIALCDKFNLVARRKIDGYGHTWRVAADDIKSARTELKGRINLYI